MAGARTGLTTRDTVLLIVAANGGEVEGRTRMQKLAYFAGLGLRASLEHRVHYYGPYSSRVEDALGFASEGGDLRETVDRFAAWRPGSEDVVQYSYALTEQGRRRVNELRERFPKAARSVDEAIAAIRDVVPDLNQATLSAAAKTYLIISEGGEVEEDNIPAVAERLGWTLMPNQVERTVAILERLDLLEEADSEPTD